MEDWQEQEEIGHLWKLKVKDFGARYCDSFAKVGVYGPRSWGTILRKFQGGRAETILAFGVLHTVGLRKGEGWRSREEGEKLAEWGFLGRWRRSVHSSAQRH